MRMYLAAPIFQRQQVEVVEALRRIMMQFGEVFSPLHASRSIWKGRAPKDCSAEERAQVLKGNILNLHCDCLVAWVGGMGGFTDPGVVWELGYATALQYERLKHDAIIRNDAWRPFIIAYIDPIDERQSMNLMIAGTINAVVKGTYALEQALTMLDSRIPEQVINTFHPDKLLAQEREPIV